MTGADIVKTRVTLTNGKTPVRSIPGKSSHHRAIPKPQGKARNVCTDTSPLTTSLTHQQNEISQNLLPNVSTIHNTQVIDDLPTVPYMPVECDISDLSASVQLQETEVNNFSREETVPLYIWTNRNTSEDCKACLQKNGHQYGYIPLTNLKLYHIPHLFYKHTK